MHHQEQRPLLPVKEGSADLGGGGEGANLRGEGLKSSKRSLREKRAGRAGCKRALHRSQAPKTSSTSPTPASSERWRFHASAKAAGNVMLLWPSIYPKQKCKQECLLRFSFEEWKKRNEQRKRKLKIVIEITRKTGNSLLGEADEMGERGLRASVAIYYRARRDWYSI